MGFGGFTRLREKKSWDWKGQIPDIKIQQAFESNIKLDVSDKFIFTAEYVSRVLDNIANIKATEPIMTTYCSNIISDVYISPAFCSNTISCC